MSMIFKEVKFISDFEFIRILVPSFDHQTFVTVKLNILTNLTDIRGVFIK